MKNLYLGTLAVLLAAGSFAQNGQIQNGGFENWTDLTLYDYPTEWINSNQQEFSFTQTVVQSTDASDGTFSAELRSQLIGTDTISGFVLHGELGQNGPEVGLPYSDAFDHVSLSYKSDLQAGDSVMLILIRSTGGVIGSMEVLPVTTDAPTSNWTTANILVSSGTQDSLFIGFLLGSVSGNSQPTPGSWVRIDNVQLNMGGTATTTLPDHSFESWSSETVELPDDWYTLNDLLAPQGLENANKTTDANTGTYAIEMSTIQDPNSGDTISSFLSIAPINLFGLNPFELLPYNATPTLFSGAYKYAPSNGDIGALEVRFYAGGLEVGSHIVPFTPNPTWQVFSSPLTISSAPDSISFLVYSGDNPGSVLKLDDLSLSGGDVSLNEFAAMNVSIYPNPATSTVLIKAEGMYDYTIIDLAGNVIMSENDINGAIQLNISDLSSGAYLVKINNTSKSETHKLIVE